MPTLEEARLSAVGARKRRTQGETAMTIGSGAVLYGAGGPGREALSTAAGKGGKKYLKAVKRGDSKPAAVKVGVRGAVKRFSKFPSHVRGRAGLAVTGASLVGVGAAVRHVGSKEVDAKESVVAGLKAKRYAQLRRDGKEVAVLKSYEDVSLVEISKGFGDWKNITQRETDAKNARRSKKHGILAASGGATLAAAGGPGGMKNAATIGRNAKARYDFSRMFKRPRGEALGEAKRGVKLDVRRLNSKSKVATAAVAGGGALVAGGAGLYTHGAAKERYNEKRIAGMRKRNAKR